MQALNVPAAGEQPLLSDLSIPEVTADHVLIKVKAAGLNGFDNAVAAGMLTQMLPHEYPVVLGRDAAGVVEAVGAGVDNVAVGDEVIGHVLMAPPIQAGTLAQYALVPAAGVTSKPAELDFVSAAALPLAGAAAVASVDAVDPQPGQTVLINGASGGVGSFVIQLLSAREVSVLATGSPQDAERLTTLGADRVFDYTSSPVAEQVRASYPEGVDALIDLVNYTAEGLPLDIVRKGGKVASTMGAIDDETVAAAGLTGVNVMANPSGEVVAGLAGEAAKGALQVYVAAVLPIDLASEGLATIAAGGAHGKIVVTLDE